MLSIQEKLEILQRLAACFVSYPIHSLSDLADGQLFHYVLWELGHEQEVSCLTQGATYSKINQELQKRFKKENLVDIKALQDGNLEEVAKLFALTLYLSACVFKNEEVQRRMQRGLEEDPMAGIYVMKMLQELQEKDTSLTSSELRDVVFGQGSVSSGGASPLVYGYSPLPSPARSFGAGAMSPATPKINSMQATLRQKNQEIRELNRQITAEHNEKFVLAENIRSSQKRIDELEKIITSLRKENQDLVMQMNKSPSPTPGDSQTNWEARKQRKDLAELEKAQVEILGLKTENDALTLAKENLQTKLQCLETKLRKSTEHVYTLEAQCATLEMELSLSTQRAQEFEGLYNEKLNVVMALQERMRECEDNHMSFALSPRQPEDSLGYQLLCDQLEVERKKFEDNTANYESKLAVLQLSLQERENSLKLAEEKVTVLQREHNTQLETFRALELEKISCQTQLTTLQLEKEQLLLSKDRLLATQEELSGRLKESDERLFSLDAEHKRLLALHEDLEFQVQQITRESAQTICQLKESHKSETSLFQSQLSALTEEKSSLQEALRSKETRETELNDAVQQLEHKHSALEQKMAANELDLRSKMANLTECEQKLNSLCLQLENAHASHQTLQLERDDFKNRLESTSLQYETLLKEKEELLATEKRHDADLHISSENCRALEKENAILISTQQDLQRQVDQLTSDFEGKMADLTKELNLQATNSLEEKTKLEEVVYMKETERTRVKSEMSELECKYGQLEQMLRAELTTTKAELEQKDQQLARYEVTTGTIRQELEDIKLDYNKMDSHNKVLEDQLTCVLLEKQGLLEEKSRIGSAVEQLQNELSELRESKEHLQSQSTSFVAREAELQSQVAKLVQETEQLRMSRETQTSELENAISKLNSEKAELVDTLRFRESEALVRDKALDELTQQRNQVEQDLKSALIVKDEELRNKNESMVQIERMTANLRQELEILRSTFETCDAQRVQLQTQVENLNEEKQTLFGHKEQLLMTMERLNEEVGTIKEQLKAKIAENVSVIATNAEWEKRVVILTQENEQKIQELSRLQESEAINFQTQIRQLTSENSLVNEALRVKEARELQLTEDLNALECKITETRNLLASKDEELAHKSEILSQTENQSAALQQELITLRSTYATAQTNETDLLIQLEALSKDKENLCEEKKQILELLEQSKLETRTLQHNLEEITADCQSLTATNAELQLQKTNLVQNYEEKMLEIKVASDSQISSLQAEISSVNNEKNKLEEMVHLKETREAELADYVAEFERKFSTVEEKLTALDQEYQQKCAMMEELEGKLASIRTESDGVSSAFKKSESQIAGLQNQLESLLAEKEMLCDTHAQLNAEFQVAQEKLCALQTLGEQNVELEALKVDLEKQVASLSQELEHKTQKLVQVEATATSLEAETLTLRTECQSAKDDAQTVISALHNEKETLLEQLDNLRVEVEISREDLANMRAENVGLETELRQAATSWEEAKEKVIEKLRETEQNVDALTNANNQLQKTCNQQKEELNHCQARITTTTATVENLQSQLKILNSERQEMKIKVTQLTKSIEETEAAKQMAKCTLEALQCECATMKADLRMLSGENNNYKESTATYEAQILALEERNVHLTAEAQKNVSAVKICLEDVQKEYSTLKAQFEVQESKRQQIGKQLTALTCEKEELRSSTEELRAELTKAVDEKQSLAKTVEQLKAERSVWQGTQSTTVQEHLQVIEKLQEQNEQLSRDCIKAKAEVVELLQFKKDAQLKRQQDEEQSEDKNKLFELMQKVEKLTHQNLDLFNKFQEAEKCASEAMDRAAKALEQHKKDWTAKREKMFEEMLRKQDLQEQERRQLENDFDIVSEKYRLAKEKLAQQDTLQGQFAELEEKYRQSRAAQARLEAENRTLKVAESHVLAKINTEKEKQEAKHQKQVQALKASSTSFEDEASVEDFMPSRRQTIIVRSLRPSVSESSATFVKDGFKVPAPAKSCTMTSQLCDDGGFTNRRDSITSLGSIAESSCSKETFVSAANATFIAHPMEESSSVNRRQSTSSLCSVTSTSSQRSVPQGAGKYFSCDDEAGEVFSSSYLSELKSGVCKIEDPLARMSELERRNTLCLPHMRSAYPTEFNDEKLRRLDVPAFPRPSLAPAKAGACNVDPVNTITEGTAALSVVTPPTHNTRGRKRRSFELENADLTFSTRDSLGGSFTQSLSDSITSQSSQGSVDRKRRKEVIMTSYHKPGPPTPAKSTSAVRERVPRTEVLSPNDTPKVSSKGKSLKPKTRTPLKSRNSSVGGSSASKKTPSSLVKRVQDKLKQSKAANDENTPRTRSKLNIFRKPFGSRSYASDI